MLSRTAEGLFWMGRYVERMENTARLLDTGRRLDSLPGAAQSSGEWSSIIVASGPPKTRSVARRLPKGYPCATDRGEFRQKVRDSPRRRRSRVKGRPDNAEDRPGARHRDVERDGVAADHKAPVGNCKGDLP